MAAWASLSGYLHFKPGGGALSRLKAKKKLWCVLDESRGQLVYHKSEEDARCKPPMGQIELRGAAISLDLDNQNQFVIIEDSKEVSLTAENHESMMIWLMALQAKRDWFAKNEGMVDNVRNPATTSYTIRGDSSNGGRAARGVGLYGDEEQRERSSSDLSVARDSQHRSLYATKSLGFQGNQNAMNNNNHSLSADSGNVSAQLRRQQLMRLGETFDVSQPSRESGGSLLTKQLSVSMEGTELWQRHIYHHPHPSPSAPQQPPQHHAYQALFTSSGPTTTINYSTTPIPLASTRVIESSSSGSTADSDDVMAEEASQGGGGGRARHSSSQAAMQSRGSSLSVSTDSAIDKGENCDMAVRVQELESELISSKCELAKVMNRQSCFQEILKQKDEIILDLDEKLGKLGGADVAYDSKRRANQASRELQERIRILQNQNRFLNEEVRRLARLRSQEQAKIRDQEGRACALEGEIELWKLQYVSLIQSSIRFTGTDTMDDAELSLYGGDRHKNKVRSLLEESRKVNPSLPTLENLEAGEVHVDYYGFKHQFQDNGLLLHYVCQELTQHYITQAAPYEAHQQRWLAYLRDNSKNLMKPRKELKALCRGGIPDQHRRVMWRVLVHDQVTDLVMEKGPHYYRSLCSMLPDSPLAARYRKQIGLDLMRTMPSNIKFSTPGSKGIMDLQDVLLAFCVHNPNIGYCQGMNFLVAMALLFMDAHDAFWTLVAVTEKYHSVSYFDQNLLGAQADQSVLRDLLADLLPNLARHLEAIDIEISTVTLNWFLAIFFDAVPFPTLLRVWDCFLLEGPKVLFRFSLAILRLHEREIVNKTETISVMRHLKACARVTYDVDGLVQLAFQGLKPFPRRQDINSKQTLYLKALKEKYRWRELQKLAFAERENLFLSLETEIGGNGLTFESCAVTEEGVVWVCYGNQSVSKVCVVDCKLGTMTDQPIQFSSRVMALCAIPGAILFGSLNWNVFCVKTADRLQAWEQQLHDAVLSLCQYQDGATCRVFAGLADGTVAVLEDVSTDTAFYDVMYIMIGQSPVTCLRLLDSHLWCACGNTVSIIHASTLDALDSFTVSSNPYDHILSLEPGLPGVWISVRGSSILELWDQATLCCKMLYDTRAGRYPNLRKDDEVYFNRARITSILPLDYSVWVGTGEGNLITYDVFTHQGSKTPSDSSSFVGSYTDSFSAFVTREESDCLPPGSEGFDPIREAAMRVRQLYLAQHDSDDEATRVSRLTVSTTSTLVNNSRESVSRDHNTTLTATPPPTRGEDSCTNPESEEGEDQEQKTESQADGTLQESEVGQGEVITERKNTLTSPAHCEEGGGITPTASFCPDLSAPEAEKEKEAQQGKLEGDDNANVIIVRPPDTDVGQGDSEVKRGSSESKKEESEREESQDAQRLKNTSPRNGMTQFYLGEDGDNQAKAMANGSAHSNEADSNKTNENDVSSCDVIMNKKNSSQQKGAVVGSQEKPSAQAETDANKSDKDKPTEAEPEGGKGETGRQTSEVKVGGSSDVSVISQVWDALTRGSKPRTGSHDSHGLSSHGLSSPASLDSQGLSSQASPDSQAVSPQKDGQVIVEKSAKLSSMGSSFTSGGSDEVFQDAQDNSSATELVTSPSSTTSRDESQYETGQEEVTPTRERSFSQLSNTSSDEGRKLARKKRPQSLFVSRVKGPKPAGGCVDKPDKRGRSKFVVGSPPTPSGHGGSSSSVNTTASTDSMDNLASADPETRYRLDYTNHHVDTDLESLCTDDAASLDSRRSSSIFSEGQFDPRVKVRGEEGEGEGSSEADVGLGMLDCDPTSFIFPQDMYNPRDGSGTVGRAMLDGGLSQLLQSPAISNVSCRTWSSYDELSTPSVASYTESARMGHKHRNGGAVLPRNNSLLSTTTTTSIASTTELLYGADMTLLSKNKISDKPVKCLLLYMHEGQPVVLSFSGSHSDDEAVLKWTREKDEMLWTNDPILEYNPATKTTKLPSYMTARLSSSSSTSTASIKQRLSQ